MSSIAKANISLSKKDLTKSRIPLVSSRNIAFYHKATVGSLSIDLLALSMPSEMPTNVQATADEISGARLLINKKNLSLVSSANGPLIQGMDYVVTSSTTIQLIGLYEASGAESGEIFVGTINSAPVSDIVVASARSVDKTYTLAVGQTTLNLGREYEVGMNPNDDIGSIKVFVNGVLAHRDADYAEVDAGSGYGTTISFFAAPVSIPYQVAVDFGVMSISDNDAIGTIESLSGAVIKIAADLADVAGTNITDYLTANPSEVERRTFGDMVLTHDKILDVSIPIVTDWVDDGPLSISASTTAPTKGVAQTDKVRWRRVGDSMQIEMAYRQTTAGAVGSGDYRFLIPAGYQIDTTKVTPYAVVQGIGFSILSDSKVGSFFGTTSTLALNGSVFVVNTTQVAIEATSHASGSNSAGVIGSAYTPLSTANLNIRMQFTVPILGWFSTQTIRQILGL